MVPMIRAKSNEKISKIAESERNCFSSDRVQPACLCSEERSVFKVRDPISPQWLLGETDDARNWETACDLV